MTSVLVVGHGLSGAVLTHTLTDYGMTVHCMEGEVPQSASQVATGLINPFIGPKLNAPKGIIECLSANQKFFGRWEKIGNQKLYRSDSLIRIFRNEQQLLKWQSLKKHISLSKFAVAFASKDELKDLEITGSFGAGITLCYRLDIKGYLKLSKEILVSQNKWIKGLFKESNIAEFDLVIFAEGQNVNANPFFNWLPFAPAQGEILGLEGPQMPLCSNGTWILPCSQGRMKAGSTWKHKDLNSGPTDKGKETIFRNLNFLPVNKYKTVEHLSGIRSGTIDRNPIIGQHPRISNLFIFNGFGSRGATTIKLNANRFADFITQQIPLSRDIDLNRF
jgi:glycine/D-amino acid oxidase-like deaminating enzyme